MPPPRKNSPGNPNNLAIETSTRAGSISVGCDDQLLETVELTQQRRHNIELMPAIARLCDPVDLQEVYLNIGPGSFTGLRIAVTLAKVLAMALNVKIVAVEAVDVLAATQPDCEHLAVCVNRKRDTVYARLYQRGQPTTAARVMTLNSLLADARRPLTILAQSPGDFDLDGHVTVLSDDLAQPRSDMLWHLGRQQAKQGKYTDPATLLPRYARPPEAVQLWDSRKSGDLARQ